MHVSTGDAGKSTATDAGAPARASRFARLRSGVDRVPTKWFAGIATAVFLAATAAFGGLATAAEPPLPELAAGDTHTSQQFSLTPLRAFISDEKIAGLTNEIDSNQDIIANVAEVENEWTTPQGHLDFVDNIRLTELPDIAPNAVALLSDTTSQPTYQPGVPATVAVAWIVDEGTFAAGDDLRVVLRDRSNLVGSFIIEGDYWSPPVDAAYATIPIKILEPEVAS
mgnify:CR=1 FL=1